MSVVGRVGWGLTGAAALVLASSWAIDARRAASVHMSVESVPSTLPADGQTSARIIVRVLQADGTARSGDVIEVQQLGGGTLDRFRALTDARGEARFNFIAPLSNKYRPAQPVTLAVTNSSLGRLIEVDKRVDRLVHVVEPREP